MNVGSLFTGVGGFDLGLERAGHNIVFQCEAIEYRRQVLAQHWPDVPIYEDVKTLGGDTLEQHRGIDLLCGGFPCQDLSVAGKRAGLSGERSGLFHEFARIADSVLGDGGWVLIENVPGLLSSNKGRDMGVVIGTLADLSFTDLSYRTLDSRYFGVPQRRRRVYILARRARGRRALQVLLEPEGRHGNPPTSGHQREGAADSTQGGTGADRQWSADVTATLNVKYGTKMGLEDQHAFNGAPCFVPGRREGATDTARCLVAGDRYDSQTQDFVVSNGSLRESEGRGQGDDLHQTTDEGGREAEAGLSDGQTGSGDPQADPDGVRAASRLPRRLDDAAVTSPVDLKPDGPRYAAMGDAVTVNVAQWIGERLNEHGGDG